MTWIYLVAAVYIFGSAVASPFRIGKMRTATEMGINVAVCIVLGLILFQASQGR